MLWISNPEKRNALDPTLLATLRAALLRLAEEGLGAAVVTGRGMTFSAGYDLQSLPEEPDADWLRGHGTLGETMRLLSEGPLPTVAALNGAAIGAGCEMALSCDFRVAHKGVSLCMPPVRLGIIYTPEGVGRMIALCGAARARQLLLTGHPIDAETAERWGLIDVLIEEDQVLRTAISLAERLAEMPRRALLGTRLLIERVLREGPNLGAASAAEILALRHEAWNSPDAKAARQRFRSGRKTDSAKDGAVE